MDDSVTKLSLGSCEVEYPNDLAFTFVQCAYQNCTMLIATCGHNRDCCDDSLEDHFRPKSCRCYPFDHVCQAHRDCYQCKSCPPPLPVLEERISALERELDKLKKRRVNF